MDLFTLVVIAIFITAMLFVYIRQPHRREEHRNKSSLDYMPSSWSGFSSDRKGGDDDGVGGNGGGGGGD